MNILIVANHWAICSARYATDAFKRLDHDVRHVGPDMGRDIWGLTLSAEYAWKPDDIDYYVDVSDGWSTPEKQFDLIIVMDSDPAILDMPKQMPFYASQSPVIVWGVDNHVRDYRRPHFDHYFLAHRNVSVMKWHVVYNQPTGEPYSIATSIPRKFDRDDMTHLPCAYDPVWFTPSPIPFADREYDVCCLGVMYPKRRELVDAMRKAGLKVLAGTGLVYEAYRDAHHNSRIALCSSVAGDVAQRVFESAAMGCAVLSDPCKDFDLLNPAGIPTYHSTEDVVAMAKALLYNDGRLAHTNIEASQAWAKPHTWDARADAIVKWREANYGAK